MSSDSTAALSINDTFGERYALSTHRTELLTSDQFYNTRRSVYRGHDCYGHLRHHDVTGAYSFHSTLPPANSKLNHLILNGLDVFLLYVVSKGCSLNKTAGELSS